MPAVTPPARGRAGRVLTSLLVGLGMLATTVAAAEPAHAAPAATRVGASSATIDYARYADVVVRVLDADGRALAGAPVRVYRRTPSGDVWVRTLTTGTETRRAHFRPKLKRTTTYLLVFPGTARHAASRTTERVAVRSFGASLVHIGSRKKGAPYQWGADGPYRFDCSGFTRWVAARYGKNLPHSSSAQYGTVRHVAKANKRIGDLVFVHDSSGRVYHVGFYAGDGRLLAATHSGDHVRLQPLWTSRYYVGRLAAP